MDLKKLFSWGWKIAAIILLSLSAWLLGALEEPNHENKIPSCNGNLAWTCTNESYWIQRPVECMPSRSEQDKVVCDGIVIEDKKECVYWMLGCERR